MSEERIVRLIRNELVNAVNHITKAMMESGRVNLDRNLALDRLNETLKDMMGTQEAILQEMKKNE